MPYTCKEAIIAHMEASGPQETSSLRLECNTQATDYTPATFNQAIADLMTEGKIVRDAGEGYPYFDFPESYYV